MALRLDDCAHCMCVTELIGYTRASALVALNDGSVGCDNCEDQEPDGGHTSCVVLYDGDEVVADFRCTRRKDEVRG